jgi:hypothetical protein
MGKKAALPLTLKGVNVYNKGQKRDDGTQAARFFAQTKAPVGTGKMKKRRASYNPEYAGPGFAGIFETAAAAWEKQLKKWESTGGFLAPFVAEGKTGGLVVSADGIDLSNDGDQVVLRKATVVYMYCALRLYGIQREEYTGVVCQSFAAKDRMSPRTVRRYLAEYFECGGGGHISAGRISAGRITPRGLLRLVLVNSLNGHSRRFWFWSAATTVPVTLTHTGPYTHTPSHTYIASHRPPSFHFQGGASDAVGSEEGNWNWDLR